MNAAAVAAAAASRHQVSLSGPPQPGQPFKFTVSESCDRMKEEFNFLQAQYHNIKLEADKLVQEKSEMQRHYVMYYEMSYGLNVEMHKQTEIAKRLNAILAQIMPFLSQEHQQQVAAAIDRAKQVTMAELNAIIGQQMQAQQAGLPHAAAAAAAGHGPPIPMGPHPGLPGLPSLPPTSAASLLSGFSGSLMGPVAHPLSLLSSKHLLHRDDNTPERHRSSISPGAGDKYRPRSPEPEPKKIKREENLDRDGQKEQDVVVDDSQDSVSPAVNGTTSPRENGVAKKTPPLGSISPRSSGSSSSTPQARKDEKPPTPNSKTPTPTSSGGGGVAKPPG